MEVYRDWLSIVEAEGHDPSQAYLYAGELQSLELSSAQRLQMESMELSALRSRAPYGGGVSFAVY